MYLHSVESTQIDIIIQISVQIGPEKHKADHDAFSLRGRFELGPNANTVREF